MIKLIIFDWDDVFTQGSIAGFYACYRASLDAVGVHFSPEKEDRLIKAKWGAGHVAQLQHLLAETPELVDTAIDVYQDNYFGDTFVNCLTLVPGTTEFLHDISKHYRLAIATGAHPKILTARLLPKFNIPDVFDEIVTIYDLDNLSHAKPHPYMANMIMKSVGVKPSETILVGDAASDMQMAWNAGIEPIAVLTGHLNEQQAKELGVTYIIKNVTQLQTVLDSSFNI